MTDLPREFEEEFDSKGETFFGLAETLYQNHGYQFTLDELAEEVDLSKSRVSSHLKRPNETDWVNKEKGDTTYVWNTEKYNPAETETTDAVFGLYTDLGQVLKKHLGTSTGTPAILGLMFFVASFVMWVFYIGYSINLFQESALPVGVYLGLGLGLVVVGLLITLLSPLLAIGNRLGIRLVHHWKN